jgi:predicted dehydrogenase
MKDLSRRKFIQGTIATGAGLALAGCATSRKPFTRVIGANDDVRVAVIGFNNQGRYHIRQLQNVPGVRIVALCDVDRVNLEGTRLREFLKNSFGEEEKFRQHGEKIETYVDARRVFDREDIDAVVIATPDHWHALLGIWACQAGKDAYIEKPVSHNVWEGFKLVEAARKYNRIVASGTQRRSDLAMPEVVEYLQGGELGEIKVARSLGYWKRPSIGYVSGPQAIPETVDYNLWCGPLATNPLTRSNLHYDWRFFWEPGSGDLPNNGVHFLDLCRWILNHNSLTPPVMSFGGRFVWDDSGETPNTQYAVWDSKPVPMTCEIKNLPRKTGDSVVDDVHGVRAGLVIECEGGCLAGGWAYDKAGKKVKQFKLDHGGGHMANFIKAVRSQKRSDLNAEILEGHLSSSLCIMGNISYRIGQALPPEQIMESVRENPEAMQMYEDFKEHMAANGVDLSKSMATIGPWLKFDPEKMRVQTDDPTAELIANTLFRRNDRPPFVVPDKV